METVGNQTISAAVRRRRGIAALASVVTVAGMLGLSAGFASADTAGNCLWADTSYAQGATVGAGGWTFTCGRSLTGDMRWDRGASAHPTSRVANPGAATDPTGRFSAGAIQPGTSYNDSCVGEQLVSGRDSVYEAVPDGHNLRWRPAGSISQWRFDQGDGTAPTARSVSECRADPQY
ncbi:hypothetical protein [Nocardia salmonicida]|uniref:hypothetical protein n=1 Tax=Nocardia salmonicida TaxID=53431 RepID=UPI000ADCA821|nr:hypothetical protein [Nocardia salmonicida]